MDILIFRKVFNNLLLNKIIFKNIHHIFINIFNLKKTLKWNEVKDSRFILAGNGYLNHLKEYYRIHNSDDLKYNRKHTVILNAFKSKSLDIIKFIIEELHYDYNSYGCYENSKDFRYAGHDLLYIATKYGDLEIIRYIDSLKNNNNDSNNHCIWNYAESFKVSPLSNDFKAIQFIFNKLIENDIDINEDQLTCAISNALSIGKIYIIEWILSFLTTPFNLDGLKFIGSAIKSGKLNVLQYCLKDYTQQSTFHINLITEASMYGHLDIIQWLFENNIDSINDKSFEYAATNNHWSVVKWLYETNSNKIANMPIIFQAVKHGQFDIFKQLMLLHKKDLKIITLDLFKNVALHGRLDILKWLHYNRTEINKTKAIDFAAENGHLEIIIWLHHNRSENCTTNAMDNAARNGHLETIKWLHENRTEGCTVWAMNGATKNGHLETIIWLHHNRTEGCTKNAIDYAAYNGHFEIVKWLHHNRSEGCTINAIDWAANSGHFEMVKWLQHNRTEGCTINAMNFAAINGDLEIVKWLHHNRTEGCTTDTIDNAAGKGHLAMVKWLHENRTEGCTTNAMDNAAKNGHLDIMKWLHENRTEGCTTDAMDYAADRNLEIMKWLYHNKPNDCSRHGMLELLNQKQTRTYSIFPIKLKSVE